VARSARDLGVVINRRLTIADTFRRSVVRRTVTYDRLDLYCGHCMRMPRRKDVDAAGVHRQSPGLLQYGITDSLYQRLQSVQNAAAGCLLHTVQ